MRASLLAVIAIALIAGLMVVFAVKSLGLLGTVAPAKATPPAISHIANQTVSPGSSTGAIPFTVFDANTAASQLTVSATSSNGALVPPAAIALAGTAESRTIAVTPATGQTGSATITMSVSNGLGMTSADSFTVTVSALPRVLVAKRPLFTDDAITSPFETLAAREVRPEEMKDYEAHKADYLPPVLESAYLRYVVKDLEADRPLKKVDFKEIKKPESLNARLFPGTRAVDLGVPKERSAGGNIQVNDWVDIYITTEVSRTDNPNPVPYTALLVPHAQVIAKRSSLYPIYAALPEGKPVEYTVATNPYRAALLEHARMIGILSIAPVSGNEKKRLDSLRDEAIKSPGSSSVAATFAPPGSPEYQAEEERLVRYSNGSLSIGDEDMVKLLRLPAIEPPPPPPKRAKPPKPVKPRPAPPPPPPVEVELFKGVNKSGTVVFPQPYTPPPPAPELEPPEPLEPVYVPPLPAKYVLRHPPEVKPQQAAPKK